MSAQSPSPAQSSRRHELVDHTSELTMRLFAPDFPALVAEATAAFAELVPAESRGAETPAWRDFVVERADRAAMLVAWLNEVVYLGEVERWLPVDVRVEDRDRSGLVVRARGAELQAPFVLVKAATLHRATVDDTDHGVQAEVTLDV